MTKLTQKITALVGDVHGYHHRMVSMLYGIEKKKQILISQVLQVGDFEAHRHQDDLSTMAAPNKYRKLGDFPQFHSGNSDFPWPVYFIGGNHEPYGWYDKHLNGSQLISNCYYFGRVGFVELNGYKIVGLSGIFHQEKFERKRPLVENIGVKSNKDYTDQSCDIELLLLNGKFSSHDLLQDQRSSEIL